MASLLSISASAVIIPTPIATDARIKTVMYSPNEVIKYTGFYGYQSSILFAPDEEIGTISLGDSIPWVLNPMGNRLFLKPVEQDATTNMTLITNKHTYFFELHADDVKAPSGGEGISDKRLTFELRIVYPEEQMAGLNSIDHVPDLEQDDLSKFNFRYTISGSDDIAPIRIFDDGEFTYFQFRNKNADVPGFWQVDKDGNESIINYRTRGDYIVVERVSARYTLRHGNSVVCVFNEAMSLGRPSSSSWFGGSSSGTQK